MNSDDYVLYSITGEDARVVAEEDFDIQLNVLRVACDVPYVEQKKTKALVKRLLNKLKQLRVRKND